MFSQLGNMNKHIEQIHLEIKKFECHLCQKKFTKKFNLEQHVKSEIRKMSK